MLLYSMSYVNGMVDFRSLNVEKTDNGYDVLSDFPQKHIETDELGRFIGEYLVVNKTLPSTVSGMRRSLQAAVAENKKRGVVDKNLERTCADVILVEQEVLEDIFLENKYLDGLARNQSGLHDEQKNVA